MPNKSDYIWLTAQWLPKHDTQLRQLLALFFLINIEQTISSRTPADLLNHQTVLPRYCDICNNIILFKGGIVLCRFYSFHRQSLTMVCKALNMQISFTIFSNMTGICITSAEGIVLELFVLTYTNSLFVALDST